MSLGRGGVISELPELMRLNGVCRKVKIIRSILILLYYIYTFLPVGKFFFLDQALVDRQRVLLTSYCHSAAECKDK